MPLPDVDPSLLSFAMVAYFCHLFSDNYVDLSDLYVDLSEIYHHN